jgi:hypothetical protein
LEIADRQQKVARDSTNVTIRLTLRRKVAMSTMAIIKMIQHRKNQLCASANRSGAIENCLANMFNTAKAIQNIPWETNLLSPKVFLFRNSNIQPEAVRAP